MFVGTIAAGKFKDRDNVNNYTKAFFLKQHFSAFRNMRRLPHLLSKFAEFGLECRSFQNTKGEYKALEGACVRKPER